MICLYGKPAYLLEKGEKKSLSVVEIDNEIIFIKDETIKEELKWIIKN